MSNSTTPEPTPDWEIELRSKVYYDPAELGCEWDLEEVIVFIRQTLSSQKQQWVEAVKKVWAEEDRVAFGFSYSEVDTVDNFLSKVFLALIKGEKVKKYYNDKRFTSSIK